MRDESPQDPDLLVVEAIYDALDRGDPEAALARARETLAQSEEDPVIQFLAGVSLLELDEAEEALNPLERAVQLDPDDAEFRANLALGLFRCCRFEQALDEVQRAIRADESLPDAHHVLALLRERAGDLAEADRRFERAARLDPDRFPAPGRMSVGEFEHHLERATALLPDEFARRLEEVAVTVESLPTEAMLREEQPPLDPELFGLFVGVPLTERSTFSPGGELPPRILLFQRNLERCFPDAEELVRQIAITVYHELGHYLGLDEEQLEAIELS